jgi:hypothetical protein
MGTSLGRGFDIYLKGLGLERNTILQAYNMKLLYSVLHACNIKFLYSVYANLSCLDMKVIKVKLFACFYEITYCNF